MTTTARLPAVVLTGYLGAGKTTAINHLLTHAKGRRIAVLVNDFGSINVDAALIESTQDHVISLKNGCVCCSIADDLSGALAGMVARDIRPDLLVVEASGVAEPGRIANHVGGSPGIELRRVVTMVDSATITKRLRDKYVGKVVTAQVSRADMLVLNKSDMVGPETLADLRDRLTPLAPHAHVLTTTRGVLDPALFDAQAPDHAVPHDDHHHDHPLEAVTWRPGGPVDTAAVVDTLTGAGAGLHRVKGFVTDRDGGLVLVQGTGGAPPERTRYPAGRAGVQEGLVMFFTPGSDQCDRTLAALLALGPVGPPAPAD